MQIQDHVDEIPITTLELSTRVRNVLNNCNIATIGDLSKRTQGELLREPNFGKVSLSEVNSALASYGIHLRSWNDLPPKGTVVQRLVDLEHKLDRVIALLELRLPPSNE
jgi:DNA-directed RNA polymerase alpha subunit